MCGVDRGPCFPFMHNKDFYYYYCCPLLRDGGEIHLHVVLSVLVFSILQTMDTSELPNIKKWVVMYPVYINSKKTMAEGRRIGVAKACENPTCAEIGDCCSYLKLPFAIEVR